MTESAETRLVRVETKQDSHEKHDDERYGRIDANMEKIANAVQAFGERLDKGFTRAHERIDEEAAKARHSLGNEMGKVQGLVREESKRAQEVEAELAKNVQDLERGGRNYIQQGMIFALGIALSSIAYLLVYGPPWAAKAAQTVGGQ